MAKINLTMVTHDFDKAGKDIKTIGKLTEQEAARIERFTKAFKSDQIDSFIQKNQRAAAAITATRGPVDGLAAEYKGLEREIQRLIKRGIDPQDDALKPLISRYNQLEKELKDVGAVSNKTAKQFSLMDGVMIGLGAGAVRLAQEGLQQLIQFTQQSGEAAAAAQEVYSKYGVVFDDVSVESRAMANNLADDFDLAGSTARELLGNTGDLLTGFGLAADEALKLSDQTNRLAIDLASFTNAQGGAAAVSKALTSAYSGEREALKTYGIVINEAMVQSRMLEQAQAGLTFESEQQAKIYATLALAQEQSKNALGDYARTVDSAANTDRQWEEQLKRTQERLGNAVNKGLVPFKRALTGILDLLNDNADAADNLELALAGSAEADYTAALEKQSEVVNMIGIGMSDLQKKTDAVYQSELEKLNIIQKQLYYNEQANEYAAIARDRNKEAAEDAAKLAAERLAAEQESHKWSDLRLEAQTELGRQLSIINQKEILAAQLGEEYNAEKERAVAVQKMLADMIAQGFTAEGAGIQRMMSQYGQYLEVKQDLWTKEAERQSWIYEWRDAQIEAVLAAEEAEAASLQRRQENFQTFLSTASTIQGSLFSVINQGYSNQTSVIEAEYARREQMIEDSVTDEEQKAKLLEELEKKKAKEMYKIQLAQFRSAQAQGIIQATMNTAEAATRAYAQWGFPAGVAAAAVLSGLGAAQIGLIASQQPPPPPAAETGGRFVVPDNPYSSRGDSVGLRVNPGEEIDVTPRGETGTRQLVIHNYLNQQVLISAMQKAFDEGEVTVTYDNIRGA